MMILWYLLLLLISPFCVCSGFQENSFVVWVNGTRQCEGNYNATFATQKDQEDMATYKFNLTLNGSPLSAGRHNIRIMKNTEADWNGGDPIPNYMIFSGISLVYSPLTLGSVI